MLDVDEYVELVGVPLPLQPQGDKGPLPLFLSQYKQHGSLIAYWRMFGACGHITAPPVAAPQAYTCCTDEHYPPNQQFVKSFVNVPRIEGTPGCGIHTCYVPGGIVDELHRMVPGNTTLTWQHIRIRHYQIKSYQEFVWKQLRGVCGCLCVAVYTSENTAEQGFPTQAAARAGNGATGGILNGRFRSWKATACINVIPCFDFSVIGFTSIQPSSTIILCLIHNLFICIQEKVMMMMMFKSVSSNSNRQNKRNTKESSSPRTAATPPSPR